MLASFNGVSKVFLLNPYSRNLVSQVQNAVRVAQRANVKQIVRLSGMDASPSAGYRIARLHGEAEQFIEHSGIPYTFLRPNMFMQNFAFIAATIKDQGRIYLPIGDGKVSYIDVEDVAAVAASVLMNDTYEGKVSARFLCWRKKDSKKKNSCNNKF